VLGGPLASASPPTLSSHNVAPATANHPRAARSGSVRRVRGHCPPPRLVSLKPCAIQARKPYPHAARLAGGKAVKLNHASLSPSSPQANRVQFKRLGRLTKAVPRPCQRVPGGEAKRRRGWKRVRAGGRKVPPVLIRTKGCPPKRTRRRYNPRAASPRAANPSTVPAPGRAGRSWRHSRRHCPRQAWVVLPAHTVPATGRAQPRETTLPVNPTTRAPSAVAAVATARCGPSPLSRVGFSGSKGHLTSHWQFEIFSRSAGPPFGDETPRG